MLPVILKCCSFCLDIIYSVERFSTEWPKTIHIHVKVQHAWHIVLH